MMMQKNVIVLPRGRGPCHNFLMVRQPRLGSIQSQDFLCTFCSETILVRPLSIGRVAVHCIIQGCVVVCILVRRRHPIPPHRRNRGCNLGVLLRQESNIFLASPDTRPGSVRIHDEQEYEDGSSRNASPDIAHCERFQVPLLSPTAPKSRAKRLRT